MPDAHVEPVEDQVARDDEHEQGEPDVRQGHDVSVSHVGPVAPPEDVAEGVRQARDRRPSRPPRAAPGRAGSCALSRYRNSDEQERVQHEEHPERGDDVARAQHRRHAVRREQHVVDDPRLAPDLGGPPAGDDRDLARRTR